ncbi:MAG: DUF3800 domain-containing protein [Candidatus Nomurabacteria bacterium]|nr:DUF3800 domain-containing protein [Candidatus Nomurabacteria bacterium]
MSKSFFFVDDSGSKEWETPYAFEFTKKPPIRNEDNLKFWRGNYFVLAGIYVSTDSIAIINPEINILKKNFFGTKYVEIKSEWLRNPHKRRKKYLEPYSKTEEELKKFVEEKWYGLFGKYKNEIQIQAFVLDKRFYSKKREKETPLQELIQVLFDRVELHPNCDCEIVFDQMDANIKSQKHNQGVILKISKKELDLRSFYKKYSHTDIRFEDSINSNFLQVADTVAYNVFRQFVQHGDSWEGSDGDTLKEYSFFSKIIPNFYHKNKRIAGYGIIKIPDTKKIRWSRKE